MTNNFTRSESVEGYSEELGDMVLPLEDSDPLLGSLNLKVNVIINDIIGRQWTFKLSEQKSKKEIEENSKIR